MTRRRSTGVVSYWADVQQDQQRRREAQARAQRQAQVERERAQRDAARAQARDEREAQRAYQQGREAEATRRTNELDVRVDELRGVLAARLKQPAFSPDRLRQASQVPPFDPGALGVQVPLPEPEAYQWPGMTRAQWDDGYQHYLADYRAAQWAEQQRLERLEVYRRQYEAWAAGQQAQTAQRTGEVDDLLRRLALGEADAVEEYFAGVLLSAPDWPDGFPVEAVVAWDAGEQQLVVDHRMPDADVVPQAARVRYVKASDSDSEVARSATERREIHRDVLAQTALALAHEIYAADGGRVVTSVVVNGLVTAVNPATGHRDDVCLVSLEAKRAEFTGIALGRVDAVTCLGGLGGELSARPDKPAPVKAKRRVDEVSASSGGVSGASAPAPGQEDGDDGDLDLFTMDPIEFENLIARLFAAMGLTVHTTARSGDQGVDVVAEDSDPIRGGKIVVQVKRYRHTIQPTVVRDLYGTVQHHGAIKGILVTTAGFGPGSHEFIRNKPLALVSGPELVGMLRAHGLPGRLGPGGGTVPGARRAPDNQVRDAMPGRLVVQVTYGDGGPVLDACALVCAGSQVLGDEHFVFFNNPVAPEDAVRLGDGTTYLVDLTRLHPRADRVVLGAAVDEQVVPARDLGRLQNVRVRVTGQDDGREVTVQTLGDGTRGDLALVFGALVRGDGGQWRFEAGGRSYRDGLVALAVDHGVDVE